MGLLSDDSGGQPPWRANLDKGWAEWCRWRTTVWSTRRPPESFIVLPFAKRLQLPHSRMSMAAKPSWPRQGLATPLH